MPRYSITGAIGYREGVDGDPVAAGWQPGREGAVGASARHPPAANYPPEPAAQRGPTPPVSPSRVRPLSRRASSDAPRFPPRGGEQSTVAPRAGPSPSSAQQRTGVFYFYQAPVGQSSAMDGGAQHGRTERRSGRWDVAR